jgi:hypothetical protein
MGHVLDEQGRGQMMTMMQKDKVKKNKMKGKRAGRK